MRGKVREMISAISSATSALEAESLRADVSANNVANINTEGFKASSVSTSALPFGGVQVTATPTDVSQGALAHTGNPNNVTVLGPGYFRVQGQNGSVDYTRNLNLSVDSGGYLRSGNNYLLGTGGPIRVPTDYQSLDISNDGSVSYTRPGGSSGIAGTINLAFFTNPGGLTPTANNSYSASAASGPPQLSVPGQNGTGSVVSGAFEVSNTDYTTEVVNSILTQRASEANVATIRTADQMLRTLVSIKQR